MPEDAAARRAIDDLVAKYCDAVARADEPTFRACWADDARWTGPGLDRHGAEAITATWAEIRPRFAVAIQQLASGAVRVDGDRATGRWWVREQLVEIDGTVRATVGSYDDEYVRVDGTWKFAARAFSPLRANARASHAR